METVEWSELGDRPIQCCPANFISSSSIPPQLRYLKKKKKKSGIGASVAVATRILRLHMSLIVHAPLSFQLFLYFLCPLYLFLPAFLFVHLFSTTSLQYLCTCPCGTSQVFCSLVGFGRPAVEGSIHVRRFTSTSLLKP